MTIPGICVPSQRALVAHISPWALRCLMAAAVSYSLVHDPLAQREVTFTVVPVWLMRSTEALPNRRAAWEGSMGGGLMRGVCQLHEASSGEGPLRHCLIASDRSFSPNTRVEAVPCGQSMANPNPSGNC